MFVHSQFLFCHEIDLVVALVLTQEILIPAFPRRTVELAHSGSDPILIVCRDSWLLVLITYCSIVKGAVHTAARSN